MPDRLPRLDLQLEIEDRSVQLRASPLLIGVWEVFDSSTLLGTIAESHSFEKESNTKYLAHRHGSPARELVGGLEAGVRFLAGL